MAHAAPDASTKAEQCEQLAQSLRDVALAAAALVDREGGGQVGTALTLQLENPLHAAPAPLMIKPFNAEAAQAEAELPAGWIIVKENNGDAWYERSDGHTQWERPTTPFGKT